MIYQLVILANQVARHTNQSQVLYSIANFYNRSDSRPVIPTSHNCMRMHGVSSHFEQFPQKIALQVSPNVSFHVLVKLAAGGILELVLFCILPCVHIFPGQVLPSTFSHPKQLLFHIKC